MISEYTHKIDERLILVREQTSKLHVQIMRVSDGKFFNLGTTPKPMFTEYSPNTAEITGTAYIANGDTILYGVGTIFTDATNGVSPGDILRVNGELVIVSSIQSDTQLTIASPYEGDTIAFDDTADPVVDESIEIYFAATPAFTNDNYTYEFSDFYSQNVAELTIASLPQEAQDLLFIYEDNGVISYERHFFGGKSSINMPSTCLVYGTLKDVSGRPLEGQKVEAYLNRAGFFTHKAGLIGYASTTITDESGYFELPLIVGLDVTISVPIIGFTQRGYVPSVSQVELTTQSLLSYNPLG